MVLYIHAVLETFCCSHHEDLVVHLPELPYLIRQVERLITIADVCFTPYNSVTHLGPTYFLFSHGRGELLKRKCHFCGAMHNILTFLELYKVFSYRSTDQALSPFAARTHTHTFTHMRNCCLSGFCRASS